jgi:DNA-binding IclR family transcriptional regulator
MAKNTKAPALERGLKVIELLAEENVELGLKSISQALEIPVPSLWRLLGVLRENGYVLFDGEKKTYRLGFKFFYLGNMAMNRMGFRSEAEGYLKQLVEATGETAELSARVKDQLILMEQLESPDAVRLFSRVGSAYPYFHATAPGKVYLAHLEKTKLAGVMSRMGLPKITEHTITRLEVLEGELEGVLKNGFASDREEMRIGVCRIAAPVYDKAGRVAVCIGIAAPAFRIQVSDCERIGPIVRDLATKLSRELKDKNGYNWPASKMF